MKNKFVLLGGVVIAFAIGLGVALGYTWFPDWSKDGTRDNRLIVVTTLFPLYDFVQKVGGHKVSAVLLLPPGIEPHAFEPSPKDVVTINQADVFIYTGPFMEVWAADLLEGTSNPELKVVDSSQGTELISATADDEDEPAGSSDPHIWLDFDNARTMVQNIARGLIEQDRSHQNFYAVNAAEYDRVLETLDQRYRAVLTACRTTRVIYGGHYAFGYLARRYQLEYFPTVRGFEPDTEPTAYDLTRLIDQIKKDKIGYIFYEELTSPELAEILANETGTRMLLLNAAHNVTKQDLANQISFVSLMDQNLANLEVGLECR